MTIALTLALDIDYQPTKATTVMEASGTTWIGTRTSYFVQSCPKGGWR